MQTSNRILDDLARVANGAVSTLAGVKDEIDILIRQRVERLLAGADMVPRDEFDAVKAMAAKARAEQEKLEARVQALEAKLGLAGKPKGRAKPKATTASKPRAKKS